MPLGLLLFLKKYWAIILLVVIAVGAVWYVGNMRVTIVELEGQVQRLQGQVKSLTTINEELHDANDKLVDSIKHQNDAIKAVEVASQIKIDETAKLVIQAQAETARLQKKYSTLLYAPSTSSDVCASTSKLVGEYIAMRRGELEK